MIKIENATPESLEGNYLIVKLSSPTIDDDDPTIVYTHQTLYHNGAEWLRHSLHRSDTDAMRYVGSFMLKVVGERREMPEYAN